MKQFLAKLLKDGDVKDIVVSLGDKADFHDVVNAVLRFNKDGVFLYDKKDILSVKEIALDSLPFCGKCGGKYPGLWCIPCNGVN